MRARFSAARRLSRLPCMHRSCGADVGRYLVAKVPNAQRAAAQYAKQRAKDKDDLGNSNRTPRVLFGGRAGRHPRIQPSSAWQEHFAGWRLLTSRLTDLTRLRSVSIHGSQRDWDYQ